MSNARQVMQIALDALEYVVDQGGGPVCEHQAGGAVCFCKENEAINALRKELAAHPQATEQAPIGFNGLTQAETEATMSVRGLSEPAPSTAGECRPSASDETLDFEARGYLTSLTFWHHLPGEDSDELAAFLVNLLRDRKKPLVKVVRVAATQPAQGERADAASALRYEWKYYAENEGANGGSLSRAIDRAAALLSAPALPAEDAVAFLHTVVSPDGEQDQALSFKPDNFPLADTGLFKSVGVEPLFKHKHAMPVGELTDEQIDEIWVEHGLDECDPHGFARAILAAASTQPVREPLTDEELDLICEKALFCRISFQQFARSIEAAHGIK